MEEERRLLFVGITRAERELYLSHCRVREFRGQRLATIPSTFLRELPDEALIVRNFSESPETPARIVWRSSESTARPPVPPGMFRLTTAAELAGEAGLPPTAGPADLNAFQPGVMVLHPQFGIGRIVSIDGVGPKQGRSRSRSPARRPSSWPNHRCGRSRAGPVPPDRRHAT